MLSDFGMTALLAVEGAGGGKGFWGIVTSGGWVGMAIVGLLLALSITAAYLIFDQLMTLRRNEMIPPDLSVAVRRQVAAGHLVAARKLCEDEPSLLAYLILNGLSEVEGGWHAVQTAMEDSLADQAARLFRKVEYLSVIGNLAPMVGLLGTVTGMIFAFQQVAATQGAAGAGDLAEGIYQALVTTVGGLLVAIPSLAAFAIFRNRVDGLVAEAAQAADQAMAPVKRRATAPPVQPA